MNKSNADDFSEVTSANGSRIANTGEATIPGTIPPKRNYKSSKSSDKPKKIPKLLATVDPKNTSVTNDATLAATNNVTNVLSAAAQSNQVFPHINYTALDGEDPDGFISIEGLQTFLGTKDAPSGTTTAVKSSNTVLTAGYQLALDFRALKRPIFQTAKFIDAITAEPETLFIVPNRGIENKLTLNIFTLSDFTSKGARKVAILVGTNVLPPIGDNVSPFVTPEEIIEFVVQPNEKIAALDFEGFTTFNLMVKAGRARWIEEFNYNEYAIFKPSPTGQIQAQKEKLKELSETSGTASQGHGQSLIEQTKLEASWTIPVFENKALPEAAYANRMFATATTHIEKSALHEKHAAEGSDKNLAELIAHSGTKTPLSYGALGGSINVLHYISIAAYAAKHQSISQVANKICERTLCPSSPATVDRYLRSWAASYQSLSVFGRLEWKLGKHRAILRLHEYMALPSSTEYSLEFYRLLAGQGEKGGDVSSHLHTIPYLKIKIENLFLHIFASTNMKYKYQIAMLQSLDRFTGFLEEHDMGDGNPIMLKFMEVTTVAYLNNLERIRSKIDATLIDTGVDILVLFNNVPDLSPNGNYKTVHAQLSIEDTRGATAMLISQADLSNTSANSASDIYIAGLLLGQTIDNASPKKLDGNLPIPPSTKKSKNAKRAQQLQTARTRAAVAENTIVQLTQNSTIKPAPAPPPAPAPAPAVFFRENKNGGPGAPPARGTTANSNANGTPVTHKHCSFFLSSNGCKKGADCQHLHEVPSKNSEAWNRVNALLIKFKQQPSDNFQNAN